MLCSIGMQRLFYLSVSSQFSISLTALSYGRNIFRSVVHLSTTVYEKVLVADITIIRLHVLSPMILLFISTRWTSDCARLLIRQCEAVIA